MTEQEIRRLLAAARTYDNRQLPESVVVAWAEAAEIGRWSYDEAQRAIVEHYTHSTDRIQPGHITQRIKQARRQPPAHRALPGAAPASDETRRAVMAQLYARMGWFSAGQTPMSDSN